MATVTPQEHLRWELESRADEHGIVSLPFIGTSWQARRVGYWFRRTLAALTYLLLVAFVAAMATGFTVGILHLHGPAGVALAAVYDATGVPGLIYGVQTIRQDPWGSGDGVSSGRLAFIIYPIRRMRGSGAQGGFLALVIAPLGTGIILGCLLMTLGRDYPGERVAREVAARQQRWDSESAEYDRRRRERRQRRAQARTHLVRSKFKKHRP